MILSIVVILLVGAIAYYHYLQGLFSAGLSLVLVAVAAAATLGYHEWVIKTVLGGKFADYANAFTLVGMFAITYLVLRVLFDALVPGNLRFPLWVDRVGAAACGALAGVLAVGVMVLAAYNMPFTASVAGYERYPLETKQTTFRLPSGSRDVSSEFLELDQTKFKEGEYSGLILPVDAIAVSFIERVSAENGSLSSGLPFAQVHPNYLDEVFAQRLGQQVRAKHTALPDSNSVLGVYTIDVLPQIDQERQTTREGDIGARGPKRNDSAAIQKLPKELKPGSGQMILIVRVKFDNNNAEKNTYVHLSPGSVRLVANGANHWPTGTIEAGVHVANYLDDPVFVSGGSAADLVFVVPTEDVLEPAAPTARKGAAAQQLALRNGAFIEIKRLDRLDLGGKAVKSYGEASPEESVKVARKKWMLLPDDLPFMRRKFDRADYISMGVGLNVTGDDMELALVPGGKASLKKKQISMVDVQAPIVEKTLSDAGSSTINQLYHAEGTEVYQVRIEPKKDSDPWAWAAAIGRIEMETKDLKRIRPAGFWVRLSEGDKVMIAYEAEGSVTSAKVPPGKPRISETALLFVVPSSTEPLRLTVDGKTIQAIPE